MIKEMQHDENYALFLFGLLLISSMGLYCSAEEPPMIVVIKDYLYQPGSITIPAGSTVAWINKDPTEHTVTATDVTATDVSFNSGNIATGAWFNQTFNRSGTYQYRCLIYASMVGEVTVTPNSTACGRRICTFSKSIKLISTNV